MRGLKGGRPEVESCVGREIVNLEVKATNNDCKQSIHRRVWREMGGGFVGLLIGGRSYIILPLNGLTSERGLEAGRRRFVFHTDSVFRR